MLVWITVISHTYARDKTLVVHRATTDMLLDGRLDEQTWKAADIADQFQMNFPYDSLQANSQTQVMLTFDDENLYIGAICHHELHGDYVIQSLKRDFDFAVNDAFSIFIDAFSDGGSGLSFSVNPYGVQRDGIIAEGGIKGINTTWDGLWYTEVFRNPAQGFWSVEIAIPFKTLRFGNNNKSWKVNFARNDLNRNEISTWVPVKRGFELSILSNMGSLQWEHIPNKGGRHLAIIPHSGGSLSKSYTPNTALSRKFLGGVDAKLALNSSLNLDMTINPDFSQVEVDQQIIDLQRFELFFPEKRLFFLENSDLFDRLGNSRVRPFFSRRVGSVENEGIPIYFGARLSGNIDRNWRLGVMSLQTGDAPGKPEVNTNFTVATIQRRVLERSTITAFINSRQDFDKLQPIGNEFNRITGVEFNFRSKTSAVDSKSYFHYSLNPGYPNAAATFGQKARYRSKKLNLFLGFDAVGENYITEMGFVPRLIHEYQDTSSRIGYVQFRSNGRYRFFIKKNKLIDFIGPKFSTNIFTDDRLNYREHDLEIGFVVRFINSGELAFTYADNQQLLFFPFQIDGLQAPFDPGNYANNRYRFSFDTGQRGRFFGKVNIGYGGEYEGTKFSFGGEFNVRQQPWGVFGFIFSQQNLMNYPEKFGAASFTLLGSKIEVSFSRNLFFTTFLQYNTQENNFNINSRFNWRFKPMSDLYIVYTENYTSDKIAIKDRAIILKVNYWFNL